MRLTPELLASAYDFLRHTEPFVLWNLPEPENVKFEVLRGKSMFGDHLRISGVHRIRLSEAMHGRYSSVLVTMAHEMIHMHMVELASVARCRLRQDSASHGPAFRSLALEVCAYHIEFDPVTF